MLILSFLLLLRLSLCSVPSPIPTIGILGVPSSHCVTSLRAEGLDAPADLLLAGAGENCFASFYSDWLQAAGARVVPIRHDVANDPDEARLLADSLNGVLFTGGGLDFAEEKNFTASARFFLQRALTDGDLFVWGTCMGFQLLHWLVADGADVLSGGFDAEDVALPLDNLRRDSRMFGAFPDDLIAVLTTQNSTMNFHQAGVEPAAYARFPVLNRTFEILSTNRDLRGREFVSSVELRSSRKNVFGSQFHPERVANEWNSYDTGIPKTADAIRANNEFAVFFVNQMRASAHRFPTTMDLTKRLIFNVQPVWDPSSGSLMTYIYPPLK